MGAFKVFLKEVVLPLGLALCLAAFFKPIYMADGVCPYSSCGLSTRRSDAKER